MKALLTIPLLFGVFSTKELPPITFEHIKKQAVLIKPKIKHETITPRVEKKNCSWKTMVDGVKMFESFKTKPYFCSGGRLTIGYGHTQTAQKYKSISEVEAEKLLERDLKIAREKVLTYVKVPLSDGQLACLTSFAFNCGEGSLKRLVDGNTRLNSGNYESVEKILPQYRKAGGKVLRGLEKRRKWELNLWNRRNDLATN